MNALYRFLPVLLLILVMLGSCKKKKTAVIEINGKITDATGLGAISGAKVTLEVEELSGGTYTSGFKVIEQTTTSSNGTYNFSFDRRNASEYQITVQSSNYFGSESSINPDNLDLNNSNVIDISLTPKSWLAVKIHNLNPFDANDVISYQITLGAFDCGSSCCNGDEVQLFGDVDTTLYCLNSGGHDLTLQGLHVKNSNPTTFSHTTYMVPKDTSTITINY